MKDYFELINLKNIFFKKINKLDVQFQQYGGTNFDDEIEKYKRYNDNLEIINKQIYLLLTIKYIEYLIEFIKSLNGVRDTDIVEIRDTISKGSNDILREIILSFIGYNTTLPSEKPIHIANITSDKYNILSGLDKQINELKRTENNNNNRVTLENELNVYGQHNNKLFDIITNNETKIKDLGKYLKLNINLILSEDEYKQEKKNIQTKFIFLLKIIKYILDRILQLKRTKPSLFDKYKKYNIFNYCNTYRYTKSTSVYETINEICKLCELINSIKV